MAAASDPPSGGLPIPGGVSARLWRDSQLEVFRALHHPFVMALGLGVLPRCAAVPGCCARAHGGRQQAPPRCARARSGRQQAQAPRLANGQCHQLSCREAARPRAQPWASPDEAAFACAARRHTPPLPTATPILSSPLVSRAQGLLPPLRRAGRPLPALLRARILCRARQVQRHAARGARRTAAAAHGRCGQAAAAAVLQPRGGWGAPASGGAAARQSAGLRPCRCSCSWLQPTSPRRAAPSCRTAR
jgi:hypothetical protein